MASMQTKAERETAIRYMVFVLMLAAMLMTWGFDGIKSFYSFTTPVALLFQGESVRGEIVGCDRGHEYMQGTGIGHRSIIRGKAPLARSDSGESAIGSYLYDYKDSGWCEKQKGKKVTMLIHPSDASQNRISSFTQLWYIPFQGLLALFWVAIASRVRVLFWITLFFNGVIIPIIVL